MARLLPRICPKCKRFVGIAVNDPTPRTGESRVYGFCLTCSYRINWKLIQGRRSPPSMLSRYLLGRGRH